MDEIRARVLEPPGRRGLRPRQCLCCETVTCTQMVLQHEYQHNETILQTLQLKQGGPVPYAPITRDPAPAFGGRGRLQARATWPGSRAVPCRDRHRRPHRRSRQRAAPAHRSPCWRHSGSTCYPVTNGEFEWLHRTRSGYSTRRACWPGCRLALAPVTRRRRSRRKYHSDQGRRGLGDPGPRDRAGPRWPASHPVCHVSYYEASKPLRPTPAKRLPTELEWEAAAAVEIRRTGAKQRLIPGAHEPAIRRNMANVDPAVRSAQQPVGSHRQAGTYRPSAVPA